MLCWYNVIALDVSFSCWWTLNLKLILLATARLLNFPRRENGERKGRLQEIINLECEQQQEGHHKTEKSHSFGQGEAQNGVWEQLLFEWWISGVANDEWTENCSDTGTRSGDSDCSSSSSDELSGWIDITCGWWSLERADLWQKCDGCCVLSGHDLALWAHGAAQRSEPLASIGDDTWSDTGSWCCEHFESKNS